MVAAAGHPGYGHRAMGDDEERAKVHAVAYEQAVRSIDQQAEQREHLRGRAGLLVSTAAVSGAFLGGLTFNSAQRDSLTGWGLAALIVAALGFLVVTLATVFIWWPTKGVFTLDPGVIVQQWADESPATRSELHRDLALYMGGHRVTNTHTIERHLRWFACSLIAFLVELIALGVAVWDVSA
jgi:hypothetical protein